MRVVNFARPGMADWPDSNRSVCASGRVAVTKPHERNGRVCVSGSTRRAASRVLRLIPLWPAQSDASQEAERLTDGWTGRAADVPNLSYSQFVLFYSFIALANWRHTESRRPAARRKSALPSRYHIRHEAANSLPFYFQPMCF